MRQHPDMILTYMWEPHRKFVERIHRDYLVHGAVAFYEVGEMLTRADRIVQTSGFSKTSDDLLRVVQSDNKVAIASDSDVMDRCMRSSSRSSTSTFATSRSLRARSSTSRNWKSGGMKTVVWLCS